MAVRLNNISQHITRIQKRSTTTTISRTMASTSSTIPMAILDDYHGIAPKYFQHIPGLHIESYPDTLQATKPQDLQAQIKRLQPYTIISSMRERTAFPAELLKNLPNLKLLLNSGMRNPSIDTSTAKELGIIVTGTKGGIPEDPAKREQLDELPPAAGYSTVVQLAWAQLLALACRVTQDDRALKTDPKAWESGFMIPLAGKALGILGLGKLGIGMAKVGVLAFGMKVIAWSENLTQEKADTAAEGAGLPKGSFLAVGKEELFRNSDVVGVHYVLSPRSRGIVGAKELGWMKKDAILTNSSRGPLIDEAALVEVLREGRIKGACLDVFDEEPLPPDSPWRMAESEGWKSEVVLGPHMGYVTSGNLGRWYQEQAEIVEQWLKGEEVDKRMN
jgi:lactate dehydrogenase-like 2-hydroxyacid dehydrogenase